MPAFAQTGVDASQYQLEVLNDCVTECGLPSFESKEQAMDYLRSIAAAAGVGTAPVTAGGSPEQFGKPGNGIGLGLGLRNNAPQTVYLNFQPGDPTYTFSLFGITLTLPDFEYTEADKEEVRDRIAADYAPYNYEFVLERPTEGEYVELQFNSNDAPGAGTAGVLPSGGILFGSAGQIDFGNDDRSVVAINDANLWPFLTALDPFLGLPSGFLLENNSGIDVQGVLSDGPDALPVDEAVRLAVINQSANTGAHELGHGVGLRHYDAWGPVGGGLPNTGQPEPTSFFPYYTHGQNADESTLHVMVSGASAGSTLADSANRDRFFSERSTIKLAINQRGRFITDEQANAGKAGLKKLQVVSQIEEGDNADGRYDVRNIVVEGEIETIGEVDTLTFDAKAGQIFNAEMISDVESSFFPNFDVIFPALTLFLKNDDGSLTEVAYNSDEFESFDAFMLDVELPETGTYVLQMEAPADVFLGNTTATGEPITIPLAAFGAATEAFYRTGQYITNAYIVEPKNGRGPKKIGGPSK
ncbi:hypothetical protein [Parvularcula maris]|uniref:Uncharacterized protein n=1 Tax=Parvularcula maris TaxID=2965077 RepID=A0A9X2RIR8_9PROT|nr:hypothetical protein [Parvularcula maris]MCQ8184142.1 hypothetical protein [Parvularcula maris]